MIFSLSAASKRNREGVDNKLIIVGDRAIQITLVDFGYGPDSGLRYAERQYALYSEGKSRADGYNKKSAHQSGRALDFYAFVDGRASWEPEHLAMVACAHLQAASELGIRVKWGGLWSQKNPPANGVHYGWDMPHIELID